MTPFFHDDHLTLYGGDCREVLRELPDESVHCVVTSPPYWGLRDYGIGEKGLGLEATPEEFVANMVDVFREVRRVLRRDGTLWLNLGDSYASDMKGSGGDGTKSGLGLGADGSVRRSAGSAERWVGTSHFEPREFRHGLKPKDLVGIPWRVAFALQADGWYLRSDIIWSKPNPMPESVTDRPTKAHEYLFLLTRSPRYYYDAEAVREADAGLPSGNGFDGRMGGARQTAVSGGNGTPDKFVPGAGRNLRSVWNIATEPYPGAHFATFPRKLVEPCVKASTSERGVCPECGAPWVRVVERPVAPDEVYTRAQPPIPDSMRLDGQTRTSVTKDGRGSGQKYQKWLDDNPAETTGWRPSCTHESERTHLCRDVHVTMSHSEWISAVPTVPAVVLDPFAGSGTTLFVAQALGRRGVGIDLSPDYLKQALERNRQTPLGLVG